MTRKPQAVAIYHSDRGYYVAEYAGRQQPFTVWHRGQVRYFAAMLGAARAYIQRQPDEVGQ